jgi:hypothetical protein
MPHTGLIRVSCHGGLGASPRHRQLRILFESRARRHLRPDRLAALGVPDGPVRKELAEGNPVMLADGRTIYWHELARPFLFQAVSNEGETGKILILLNKSPCVSLFHRFQREALANFE